MSGERDGHKPVSTDISYAILGITCPPGDAMHPPGEIMGYHENMRHDDWFLRREWKLKSLECEETVLTSIPCTEGMRWQSYTRMTFITKQTEEENGP